MTHIMLNLLAERWVNYLAHFGTNREVQAAIAVLMALIIGKLLDLILSRAVALVMSRPGSAIDERVLLALRRPLFVSVVIAGLSVAAEVLELNAAWDKIFVGTLKTLLVLVWFFFAIRTVEFVLRGMASHPARFRVVQPATLPMFEIASKVLVSALAIYFLILAWNADPTAWLTSAGVIGIAIGFAAKDTLANLFAGVSILADAPYKIGDYIVLEGDRGQVIKIGLRSTRILTRDDIEITIPNSTIANSKITNESGGPSVKHRVRVPVGVAYGSDVNRVRTVLEQAARSNSYVCAQPEPRVRFRSFGDSSLNFEVLCWIEDPTARGLAVDSLNTEVYHAFRKAGIEIPFPKRDVYVRAVSRPVSTLVGALAAGLKETTVAEDPKR